MDKKAKAEHTPEQRAAIQKMVAPKRPPLDDDLRWLPIENARERRAERTRDNDLAVLDLMEVLAQGRLPCIIRSTTTGERKQVASKAWTDQIMLEWWPSYGVRVVHRHQPGEPFPNIVKPFRGWVFYVWQPVLDHIWPPRADSAPVVHDDGDTKEPVRAIDRAKEVLLYLYPTKAQMPRSLKKATGKVEEECRERGWKPPSEDTVRRAAVQLGHRSARKRQ
jgi:hypothetical protein